MSSITAMRKPALEKVRQKVEERKANAKPGDIEHANRIIAKAKEGLRASSIETLSPETCAILYLDYNAHNRTTVPNHVLELARRQTVGLWKFNNMTLGMYQDGNICDAGHRTAAFAVSGERWTTGVIYGVDKGAVDTIDDGKPRSAAGTAELEGHIENAYNKQVVVKMCAAYRYRQTGKIGRAHV